MKIRLMQKLVKDRHLLRLAFALCATSLMTGCSYLIITQHEQSHDSDVRRAVILGASRSQIIDKVGQPSSSESAGGKLVDSYDLRLLPPGAYPYPPTVPYGLDPHGQSFGGSFGGLFFLSDMATLGGLEVLAALWAIHDVHSKSQLCRFTLTYGPGDHLEKVDSTTGCLDNALEPPRDGAPVDRVVE